MRHVSASLIVLSLVYTAVTSNFIIPRAAGDNVDYVGNENYTLGSVQEIQWYTELTSYRMVLLQQIGTSAARTLDTVFAADANGAGTKRFNWVIQTYGSDLATSNIYFFWVNQGMDDDFTSHYFNIVKEQTTSSSTSTSYPISSSSSSTIKTASAAPTTSSFQPSGHASSDTDTHTLKVGFGVGLGLGLPLVLIAGIWMGWKLLKHRKTLQSVDSKSLPTNHTSDRQAYSGSPFPSNTQYEGPGHPMYERRGTSTQGTYEAPSHPQFPVELDSAK